MKTIRVDTPIERLAQIQPELKSFMLQILNPQQNNSNFTVVNCVTDNKCDKNILPYVNTNSLKKWKIQKNTGFYLFVYLFIYIYPDLYPAHKTNTPLPLIQTVFRKTEDITQNFRF